VSPPRASDPLMIPAKRRKLGAPAAGPVADVIRFPHVAVFLLEKRMGASRRAFLTGLARSKGFRLEDSYSPAVTHVVSEKNSGDEVQAWLETQTPAGDADRSVHLLNMTWFTESMAAGHPVKIESRHRLQVTEGGAAKSGPSAVTNTMGAYACQRKTPLEHHNAVLTDALLLLAENADFCTNEGRSVAFKRAASVLKALPGPVRRMEELQGLPCLGEHCQRVIKEILEHGASSEVEMTRHSEHYQAMKALTGIFGVGVKTAEQWHRAGIRHPADLVSSEHKLNRAQRAGVEYYEHLRVPVTKAEADRIGEIVKRAVDAVLLGAEITLTGGFRRGKQTGHDVDFLITHPDEGREEGLLPKVVSWLEARDLLLYQKTNKNSYLEAKEWPARPPSNMDRFERCFSIFKLQRPWAALEEPPQSGERGAAETPGWKAVRVDLVVTPVSQFAFALLGWTGSQLFERDLRRWAGQKGMSLSSHALYDCEQKRYLRATSEEEIFAHLGLEYIPPGERNA
uniref:DNA-directed DNA/RNA polymerase mu n=1 Tax=Scleropages formosus TaxID=113540 RepID=A0A8C9RSF5_SCLFO